MWFAKLPSGVSLLYPKQCIAMETVPCDHPVIFHEFCLWTPVGMSAKWGVPVPNLSLLVMLCLVFVVECIDKVINFKWLSKNINADASNLIGKAKFIIAVAGPVTLLSTDAALESRMPQQSSGSRNTIAIANLCHSLTSHHACTSAAANEKSWVAQWTTQMVPWAGLGRVPDLRVWVQVRVLVICVSTSTSTSTWLLHEYESESEYWLMSTSTNTSTGLWSIFYISSSIAFFNLWKGNPHIFIILGQRSNCPLSM